MGCNTEICSIDFAENLEGLARLPRSVEWRVFRSERHGRLFLDHGFDPADEWQAATFSEKPNFGEGGRWEPLTYKLDARHEYLNDLVRQPGMAEQMCRPVVKYAQKVSALIKGRVFFAIADNNGHDSICIAEKGRILAVRFCNGPEIISVDARGAITSSPNPYDSEEAVVAAFTTDECARHFGYRLACLDDVCSPVDDPDTYTLVSRSPPRKRRRRSLILFFLRLLWRGPY